MLIGSIAKGDEGGGEKGRAGMAFTGLGLGDGMAGRQRGAATPARSIIPICADARHMTFLTQAIRFYDQGPDSGSSGRGRAARDARARRDSSGAAPQCLRPAGSTWERKGPSIDPGLHHQTRRYERAADPPLAPFFVRHIRVRIEYDAQSRKVPEKRHFANTSGASSRISLSKSGGKA